MADQETDPKVITSEEIKPPKLTDPVVSKDPRKLVAWWQRLSDARQFGVLIGAIVLFGAIVAPINRLYLNRRQTSINAAITADDAKTKDGEIVAPAPDQTALDNTAALKTITGTIKSVNGNTVTIDSITGQMSFTLKDSTAYESGAQAIDGSKDKLVSGQSVTIIYDSRNNGVSSIWYR